MSDATRLRIRGCFHEPPHASFDACSPENDAWMFPGSNVPVAEPEPAADALTQLCALASLAPPSLTQEPSQSTIELWAIRFNDGGFYRAYESEAEAVDVAESCNKEGAFRAGVTLHVDPQPYRLLAPPSLTRKPPTGHSSWCALTLTRGTTCDCDWFEQQARGYGLGRKGTREVIVIDSVVVE